MESLDSQRIRELFHHYAERVDQAFPVEVMKKWHQPAERPLSLRDVVGCVDGLLTQTTAVDERREVAVLEGNLAIVKIVILHDAVIFIDLGTRDSLQSEAKMAEIAENLAALVHRSPQGESE